LALTSIVVYWTPSSEPVRKQVPLTQVLSDIDGWTAAGHIPLDPKIVQGLQLDDYINQNYFAGLKRVSLYIGYYFTTKKVGAAHDPLVCFPGQGWLPSDRTNGKFVLNGSARYSISYSAMAVQRGTEKQLIIYWFQSYDQTNADTFSQKLTSLWKKLICRKEDNAFVRITVPVRQQSLSESRRIALEFIQQFYPVFLDYVKQ